MTGWTRYVAVGDSFTEGLNDDGERLGAAAGEAALDSPGRFVGWADRLAGLLGQDAEDPTTFRYANLAVRGRLLAEIVGPQLDAALALGPDLVSIVGGGNDILRPRADVDALVRQLEAGVAHARASGADVLMATPVDPADAPLIRHTRGRAGAYAAHINSIARAHGAYVVDQWGMSVLRDWRIWADDRIHMVSEGHRRVALEAFASLTAEHVDRSAAPWRVPLDETVPAAVLGLRSNAEWARQYVAPWVQRRLRGRSSGDARSAKRPVLGRWPD